MKIQIEIGLVSDPLTKQLKGFLPQATARALDKFKEALGTTYIHGLLTDAEFQKAAKRLIRLIQIEVNKHQHTARNVARAREEAGR